MLPGSNDPDADVELHHIVHDVGSRLGRVALVYIVVYVAVRCTLRRDRDVMSLLRWILIFAFYLYAGAAVFPFLELPTEVEARRERRALLASIEPHLSRGDFTALVDALGDANWTEVHDVHWNFAGATFFAFTLMTTIGYGSFAPATANGRIFTMIYAPFGIAVAAVTYVKLAGQLLRGVEIVSFAAMRVDRIRLAFDRFDVDGSGGLSRAELALMLSDIGSRLSLRQFEALVREATAAAAAGGAAIGADGELLISCEHFSQALRKHPELKQKVLAKSLEPFKWTFTVVLIVAMVASCTAINTHAEGWNLLSSAYFSVITFTTIGLGDLVPAPEGFATWGVYFYLAALGVTALLVSALVDMSEGLSQLVFGKDVDGDDGPPPSLSRRESWDQRAGRAGGVRPEAEAIFCDAPPPPHASPLNRAIQVTGGSIDDEAWNAYLRLADEPEPMPGETRH